MNRNLMLLLKTSATPWTPAVPFAAGAKGCWYDPSDLSTLFQDDAGTTPVTATGQSVGKVLDKSGLGNHLTQTASTQRPTLQNDGTNYYLSFDGSNDQLSTASNLDLTGTNEITHVVGLRKTRNQAAEIVYEHGTPDWVSNGGSFIFVCTSGNSGDVQSGVRGTSQYQPSISVGTAATVVVTQTAKISTPAEVTWKSGSQALSATTSLGTGNMRSTRLMVGYRGNNTFAFAGRLYQMAVWNALSDAATLAKVDAWCNSKTGAY